MQWKYFTAMMFKPLMAQPCRFALYQKKSRKSGAHDTATNTALDCDIKDRLPGTKCPYSRPCIRDF